MLLVVIHGVILLALLFGIVTLLANLRVFDSLPEPPATVPVSWPWITVCVPARNEAVNIAACVESLLAQQYPGYDLLVVDDHSEDQTAAILEAIAAASPKPIRVLRGRPLPDGWTGKNWACHQMSGLAKGEYLLFTDADTIHEPGMLAALVAHATARRADLVSAWPRLVTVTLGERLVVPMVAFASLAFFPIWCGELAQRWRWLADHTPPEHRRRMGAATGQCLFFSRSAYDRIGGHDAVRGEILEDLALGRQVTSRVHEGMRLVNCDGGELFRCRMYRSFAEVWLGFGKNVRAAVDFGPLGFFLVGAAQTAMFLLPFGLLAVGGSWRAIAAVEVGAILAMRAAVAWRLRTDWTSVILHPVCQTLCLAIGAHSWWMSSRAGVPWKGRTYAVRAGDRISPPEDVAI